VRSIAIAVFSYMLIDNQAQCVDVDGTTIPANMPFLSFVREDDDYDTLARRLAAHTGEKDTWHDLQLATVDNHIPASLPRTAAAHSTPATSPQISGRKSSFADSQMDAQVDSQATEIDPGMSCEPIEPPTVPEVPPEYNVFNMVRAGVSAVHHAFVGPPPPPPSVPPPSVPPPQSLSPSASTDTTTGNGAVPSVVPTALWRHIQSRYGRMPTRHQLTQKLPMVKGGFARVGIQRGVSSTASPRVG